MGGLRVGGVEICRYASMGKALDLIGMGMSLVAVGVGDLGARMR